MPSVVPHQIREAREKVAAEDPANGALLVPELKQPNAFQLPRRMLWHDNVRLPKELLYSRLQLYRRWTSNHPAASSAVAIFAVHVSFLPYGTLAPDASSSLAGHSTAWTMQTAWTMHYVGCAAVFLTMHLVLFDHISGADAWTPYCHIAHFILSGAQLMRAATLFANGGESPVDVAAWTFPLLCASVGFIVSLSLHLTPSQAVRTRMAGTVLVGLLCTALLYFHTAGRAMAYPPAHSSLAGSLITWGVLAAVSLFLHTDNRQWLMHGLNRSALLR